MSELQTFTVDQLADRWQCSIHTIYGMLRDGRLTGFRIGGMARISADEVGRIESVPYDVHPQRKTLTRVGQ